MSQSLIFEDHYKKLGIENLSENLLDAFNGNKFRYDIKVLYIPSGSEIAVDFNHFKTAKPSLFFPDQSAHKNFKN
ncbi:hypothetical protein [Chryseobacterium sp. POE27]|uniref:hypothetical protein n=1 Tax=Chryseobacterium sp. POE27 TaxID=3138177 RepID=UPI00321C37F3